MFTSGSLSSLVHQDSCSYGSIDKFVKVGGGGGGGGGVIFAGLGGRNI